MCSVFFDDGEEVLELQQFHDGFGLNLFRLLRGREDEPTRDLMAREK